MTRRSGFALLTTLWAIAAFGAIVEATSFVQHSSIQSAQNRIKWYRSYWRALGCARRAQAVADSLLDTPNLVEQTRTWRELGERTARAEAFGDCGVTFEAAGTRIDLNGAPSEVMERGFAVVGDVTQRSMLVGAVLALRDSMRFVDIRQLQMLSQVPPADSLVTAIDRLFSVDAGRICLATASEEVLTAIPGFTPEAARTLVEHRRATGPVDDLSDLLPLLSHSAQSALIDRYPDAVKATSAGPDAWIITSIAPAKPRMVVAEVRLRWARGATGVDVVSGRIVR